jgi:hypothetical protein
MLELGLKLEFVLDMGDTQILTMSGWSRSSAERTVIGSRRKESKSSTHHILRKPTDSQTVAWNYPHWDRMVVAA